MNLLVSRNKLTTNLILILVVFSWVLYPFTMIYFLAHSPIQMLFSGLFLGISLVLFAIKSPRLPRLALGHYVIIILWMIYLFFLLIASSRSADSSAMGYFTNFFVKALFFFLLLMCLNYNLIYRIFKLYAHLMLFSTILAIAVAIGFALDLLKPIYVLQTITANGDPFPLTYYWGAVYGSSSLIFSAPFPLYRLQAFVGEPGSFAMALAPAFYWFLFLDKKIIKIAIIAVGLIGTFSLGIAICFLFLILLLAFRKKRYFQRLALALLIFLIVSPFLVYGASLISRNDWGPAYLASKFVGQNSSGGARVQEILITSAYLVKNPVGTGAGVGMAAVSFAIANGYVKVFLESGYFGGVAYAVLFFCMGMLAYRTIIFGTKNKSSKNMLAIVLGLSVITVLFMGLQREQPDLSFWHMWLYASLFVASSRRFWKTDNATE